MDWNVIFAGGTFGIALASAISAFIWLIIRLVFRRLEDDIGEIKKTLSVVIPTIKTETELETMMDLKIAKCKEDCLKRSKKVDSSK